MSINSVSVMAAPSAGKKVSVHFFAVILVSYEQSVTRYLFMIVRLHLFMLVVGVLASHQCFISEKENLIALSGVVSFAQKSWRGPFLVCLVDDARLAT